MFDIRIVALDFYWLYLPGFCGIIDVQPNVQSGKDDEQCEEENQINS
jgi:hypothetical protein